MTCEEFRRAYNSVLDGALSDLEARRVFGHAEECPACTAYRQALARLDAELRRMEHPPVPETLVGKLEQIPLGADHEDPMVAWRPELVRALLYALGAVLAFALLGEMGASVQAAGDFVLAFAGALIFFLSVLRALLLPATWPRPAANSAS